MSIYDWENEGGFVYSDKTDKPCDNYFGNVCGGFGARTICDWCGWEMSEHPSDNYWWPSEEGGEG